MSPNRKSGANPGSWISTSVPELGDGVGVGVGLGVGLLVGLGLGRGFRPGFVDFAGVGTAELEVVLTTDVPLPAGSAAAPPVRAAATPPPTASRARTPMPTVHIRVCLIIAATRLIVPRSWSHWPCGMLARHGSPRGGVTASPTACVGKVVGSSPLMDR